MEILQDYYKTLNLEKKKPTLLTKPVTAPLYTRMIRETDHIA
jgi:hypothetical protein